MNTERLKSWRRSYRFANGLRLWYRQSDTTVSMVYGIIDAGSSRDEHKRGIAHFTEHLLFDGNSSMSGRELKEYAARHGLSINAGTGKDFMIVQTENVLPEKLPNAVEVLAQTIIEADFNGEDFEREKRIVLSEIRDAEDRPMYKAFQQVEGMLLAERYRYPVLGTVQTVSAITKDDVKAFYAKNFVPEKTIICYAGPRSSEEVANLVAERFGKWQSANALGWEEEKESGLDRMEGLVAQDTLQLDDTFEWQNAINKDQQQQVVVVVGYPGTKALEDDKVPLALACQMFGNSSMINRMFRRLREEKGLCYSATAHSGSFLDEKGIVKLVGTTSHMQYKDYVNELLGLVKEVMTTNKFTEEELEAAKIAGKTGLYALFDNFGDSESLFLHDWLQSSKIPLDKELEKFEAATLTEVQTVFNRYFGQEPTIITVGKLDSQPEQPEVEDNAEQLAAQTLDRPTPAGSHATQPNAVKPSYIPVPVRKEDEIQKPAGQAEQPTEIAEEPEIDSDIADDEDELAEDLGDNEINTNPLTESTCAGCGKPFQHLPGVNVKKCPDCKVADIEGTSKRTVEHVALYGLEHPDKTLGHSRLVTVIDDFTSTPLPASITMAGAKSEGKDYGSKASSQLKPASAPPIVPVGKKSEGGGGDSGTAGAEKAGGKDKFKPATGKGVVSSEGGEDSQAAEEAANERQNDLEAEHEQAGAEAVGGKGSAWSPEDHPRSSDTGKFIDA